MNRSSDEPEDRGVWGRTQWGTVLKAKEGGDTTRFAALERLLERYRRPIMLQIRHASRCNEMEAEELAHEFIAHWMNKNLVKGLVPDKGTFRGFIKECIRNFLIDYRRRGAAKKRNPEGTMESLDDVNESRIFISEATGGKRSPDEIMDALWAQDILARALAELERICVASRHKDVFHALKPMLLGDPRAESYAAIAARLGVKQPALRTANLRMKERLGQLIRDEVKQTVGSREDWETELRYLIEIIGRYDAI